MINHPTRLHTPEDLNLKIHTFYCHRIFSAANNTSEITQIFLLNFFSRVYVASHLAKKKLHKCACHLCSIYLPLRLLHVATPKTTKGFCLIFWRMFFTKICGSTSVKSVTIMIIIMNTLHSNLQSFSLTLEHTFQTYVKLKTLERKNCVEYNPQSPHLRYLNKGKIMFRFIFC
jgi:hypothetical protein